MWQTVTVSRGKLFTGPNENDRFELLDTQLGSFTLRWTDIEVMIPKRGWNHPWSTLMPGGASFARYITPSGKESWAQVNRTQDMMYLRGPAYKDIPLLSGFRDEMLQTMMEQGLSFEPMVAAAAHKGIVPDLPKLLFGPRRDTTISFSTFALAAS